MKTKAVRIYGVDDLRLDEFELPAIKEDEILARVVSDSICMSSHKLAMQGNAHKRVRADLKETPIIIGILSLDIKLTIDLNEGLTITPNINLSFIISKLCK